MCAEKIRAMRFGTKRSRVKRSRAKRFWVKRLWAESSARDSLRHDHRSKTTAASLQPVPP